MQQPIRVIIADDEELFATGAKTALESYTSVLLDVRTVTETVDDIFEVVAEFDADILFLDLDWFGEKTAGETAIKKILALRPHLPVVAISAYPGLVESARKAGARKARTKRGLSGKTFLDIIIGILATDESALLSGNIKQTGKEYQTFKNISDDDVRSIKINGMRRVLQQTARRLWQLKEQLALLGISADPALTLEIEDTENRIAQLEKELSDIEIGGGNGGKN